MQAFSDSPEMERERERERENQFQSVLLYYYTWSSTLIYIINLFFYIFLVHSNKLHNLVHPSIHPYVFINTRLTRVGKRERERERERESISICTVHGRLLWSVLYNIYYLFYSSTFSLSILTNSTPLSIHPSIHPSIHMYTCKRSQTPEMEETTCSSHRCTQEMGLRRSK